MSDLEKLEAIIREKLEEWTKMNNPSLRALHEFWALDWVLKRILEIKNGTN